MKLNYGSLFFNMNLANDGGTPAWGTELGQGEGYRFKDELEMKEIITSLVYTNIGSASWENIYCPLGKGGNNANDYELKLASVYDKVYVNGELLEGQRFLLLIVKLLRGDNHVGRCTLKYNPKITLGNEGINQNCYNAIAQHLGVAIENGNSVGAWFISDIILKNQDELHFICHVVNSHKEVAYPDTASRKNVFKSFEESEERKRISGSINSSAFKRNSLHNSFTHHPLLSALRTKPFMLLAGISGTGKSRSVRKLAQATVTEALQRKYGQGYDGSNFDEDRWRLHKPANFELIQVKPNWHNSMDVVGYLSNIPEPHYVFTPFVHFIVKAWEHPDVPFFLCLDEMNLAPVEEYFAEFLSAIESRSFENGEYETDPIIKPFNEFGEKVSDSMLNALLPDFKASEANGSKAALVDRLRNKGLTLPKNLIVIGTVNMDETTFSFSRKVLDRAMSIEMNEVDYDKFISGATDDDIKTLCSQIGRDDLNRLLVDRHIEAGELTGELNDEDVKFVIDYLKSVNCLFDGTPFKLGYRASNEALIYLAAAKDFGVQSNSAAMDDFTLMKILSRIEGDESKLKLTDSAFDRKRLTDTHVDKNEAVKHGALTLLTALREIIKNQLGEYQSEPEQDVQPKDDETQQDEQASNISTEPQPKAAPAPLRSIHKIDSMISQLERDRFVSYWN